MWTKTTSPKITRCHEYEKPDTSRGGHQATLLIAQLTITDSLKTEALVIILLPLMKTLSGKQLINAGGGFFRASLSCSRPNVA